MNKIKQKLKNKKKILVNDQELEKDLLSIDEKTNEAGKYYMKLLGSFKEKEKGPKILNEDGNIVSITWRNVK